MNTTRTLEDITVELARVTEARQSIEQMTGLFQTASEAMGTCPDGVDWAPVDHLRYGGKDLYPVYIENQNEVGPRLRAMLRMLQTQEFILESARDTFDYSED